MFRLQGRILNRSKNILALQKWVIAEDFFKTSTCAQHVQNIRNTNPQTTNAGPSATLPRFDANPLK